MNEIFEKYDGVRVDEDLIHIPEISCYNNNYYHYNGALLFGRSDDDNTTEWYLMRGEMMPLLLGCSFILGNIDDIEVIMTDKCYR